MDIWGQSPIQGLSGEQFALIVLVQIWDLIWKGFALWRAARNKDIFWFVLLIMINSAGLLPAVYLFYMSKKPPVKKKLIRIHMPGAQKPEDKGVEDKPKKKTTKKK